MKQKMIFTSILLFGLLAVLVMSIPGHSQPAPPYLIEKLNAESNGEVEITWNSVTDTPSFIRGSFPVEGLPEGNDSNSSLAALAFIDKYADVFGVSNTSKELTITETFIDEIGMRHVSLQQVYQGIEVFGARMKVHLNVEGQEVVAASSGFIPGVIVESIIPKLSIEDILPVVYNALPKGELVSEPRLVVFVNADSIGMDDPARLAWVVELSDNTIPARNVYIIDAVSGNILDMFDRLYTDSYSSSIPYKTESISYNQSTTLDLSDNTSNHLQVQDIITMEDGESPLQVSMEPFSDGMFTFLEPPYLSEDGNTLYNANLPRVLLAHPDGEPPAQAYEQPPEIIAAIAGQGRSIASFEITYLGDGDEDLWGTSCMDFPLAAKTAFDAAAAIWANHILSPVPITITACWATGLEEGVLGYSGGSPYQRNFTGAPQQNIWYQAALANSLAGEDLNPANADMHIAYNSTFNWYTGTDSKPNAGQYDLVTVAAHEIAHGLNFSGSARRTQQGNFLYGFLDNLGNGPFSAIYDTFLESGNGAKLTWIEFTNSSSLETFFTSKNVWWNGTHAIAANGGTRVKIYAPSSWSDGSSISHLDYDTFYKTEHRMMVYRYVSAIHDPGAVTVGLLKDMGWNLSDDVAGRRTYDAEYGYSLPGTLVRLEGDGPTGDPDVDNAHDFAGATYDYFLQTHGRDSFDNQGAPLISTANYGVCYMNAFWDGTQVVYGAYFPVKDIVAHEITHGVIEHSANLEYRWQSGALNESFADIFAAMVDRDNWLIGEALPKNILLGQEAIRDMADPTRFGQPDHTDDWLRTCSNNEGVHTNSGIVNKAYYNIATSIGKDQAELIFYRALTVYLDVHSSLEDARAAVLQSTEDLYGKDGDEYNAVREGFNNVGLDGTWKPAANNCTCAATTALSASNTANNRLSTLQVASTLYRVRDQLLVGETGGHYQSLYEQHTGHISVLILSNLDLLKSGEQLLTSLTPALDNMMAGRDDNDIVTEDTVESILSFLGKLSDEDRKSGDGSLADTIEREITRIDWAHMIGMTYSEAWRYFQSLSFGNSVYLPFFQN